MKKLKSEWVWLIVLPGTQTFHITYFTVISSSKTKKKDSGHKRVWTFDKLKLLS